MNGPKPTEVVRVAVGEKSVMIHKAGVHHGQIILFPTLLPVDLLNLDRISTCRICWPPSPDYVAALEAVRDEAERVRNETPRKERDKGLERALTMVPPK